MLIDICLCMQTFMLASQAFIAKLFHEQRASDKFTHKKSELIIFLEINCSKNLKYLNWFAENLICSSFTIF